MRSEYNRDEMNHQRGWSDLDLPTDISELTRGIPKNPDAQMLKPMIDTGWVKPTFLIVGAARCGTTTLFHLLRQHPQVYVPVRKETQYLTSQYGRGFEWYLSFFRNALKGEQIGECTPYYLSDPRVPARARMISSDLRMIVLVRNPADRAYSQYWRNVALGRERLSFEDALRREPERIAGEYERMLHDDDYHSFAYKNYAYRERSRYSRELRVWLRHFPLDQILCVQAELFFKDPNWVMKEIESFLGIASFGAYTVSRTNAESYPHLASRTRLELVRSFDEDSQELSEIVGWTPLWD